MHYKRTIGKRIAMDFAAVFLILFTAGICHLGFEGIAANPIIASRSSVLLNEIVQREVDVLQRTSALSRKELGASTRSTPRGKTTCRYAAGAEALAFATTKLTVPVEPVEITLINPAVFLTGEASGAVYPASTSLDRRPADRQIERHTDLDHALARRHHVAVAPSSPNSTAHDMIDNPAQDTVRDY